MTETERRDSVPEEIPDVLISLLHSIPVVTLIKPEIRYKIFKIIYDYFYKSTPITGKPENIQIIEPVLKLHIQQEITSGNKLY